MADDIMQELRSASAAAEDYLNTEYGRRAGRNAAILMDAASDISDSVEMRLISLAHAFVFEYFEGAYPERSLQGCLQSFLNLTSETLEGLFDYDEWNGAVDSYLEACEDIADGYRKNAGYDPRSLASPPSSDPLDDDDLAEDDPEACAEGHLRYVPDSILQHLFDTVQLINEDRRDNGLPDPRGIDPTAVVALLRSIHMADRELADGSEEEQDGAETRIDLVRESPSGG